MKPPRITAIQLANANHRALDKKPLRITANQLAKAIQRVLDNYNNATPDYPEDDHYNAMNAIGDIETLVRMECTICGVAMRNHPYNFLCGVTPVRCNGHWPP